MKCPSYNLFFETIATKTRMDIMWLLRQKPFSVTEICSALGEEQSKISHNLKRLVECNIVEVHQKGKQRIYHLNKGTIEPILDLVEKHVQAHCGKECKRGSKK